MYLLHDGISPSYLLDSPILFQFYTQRFFRLLFFFFCVSLARLCCYDFHYFALTTALAVRSEWALTLSPLQQRALSRSENQRSSPEINRGGT